ncbi:lyase [Sphingomonas sp. MAH-20]|uniref:Virginiamycin B lyase n=1 Tax=Sphingomonas horti TaxID=2682842 RepID=A0A6I4J1T9_9SPHN|nr:MULTISPECIES: SMP-30/gluconolactonase/LRE family protein [Sphingomonas]MBA2918559.1 SMP-30/gluconolactonase/LRE family protein [Sphingomonas sp. CGMCC 1.13658]MVO78590.1 lyase [Sphingomonas horti]
MTRFVVPALLLVAGVAVPACAQPAPVTAQSGNVRVFDVPAGSRLHDVAPAPDGRIWYTAQRTGKLGTLDPKTGRIEEVPLGDGSAPHGVIQGPDGAAWITDGGLNAIVRYDPKTKAVQSWPLPADFPDSNLNTAAFDGRGRIWFTGQAGVYGRLDPKTGKMDVWRDPEGRGPYGIAATPDGQIWYVSLAGSHVAKVDLDTGAPTIVEPPTAEQGARRVWADSKGHLWISEWNGGQLTRYTPSTGTWKSWKPAGERPRVYAVYVDGRDTVWISDFGANAVLSFDPAIEQWRRFPGSGENANVRQILGADGLIYLPESGLDRIMVVDMRAR